MHELLLENQLSRQIRQILKEKPYAFKTAKLKSVEVRRFKQPMDVIATVYGSVSDFNYKQVKAVQKFIFQQTGLPLQFHLRIIPLKEIDAMEVQDSKSNNTLIPV